MTKTTEVQLTVLTDITEAYDYTRLTPEAQMVLAEVEGTFVTSDALLEMSRAYSHMQKGEVYRALRSLGVERRIREDDGRYMITSEGQRVIERIKPIKWVVEDVTVGSFTLSDMGQSTRPVVKAVLGSVDGKQSRDVELDFRPYADGKLVALMPESDAVPGHEIAISKAINTTLLMIFDKD